MRVILSYIITVTGFSIRVIVRPVHENHSTSASSYNISDHAHQCGHHCRTFFSRTFSSSSSVSSFLGISVCEQESVLSFHPRLKSRWSRHIGQCYSSVSFLHFFLLPLFLSFISSSRHCQYYLLCGTQVIARVCQLFFITGDRKRVWVS